MAEHMQNIQRADQEYQQYGTDNQRHEAGFRGQAAEGKEVFENSRLYLGQVFGVYTGHV